MTDNDEVSYYLQQEELEDEKGCYKLTVMYHGEMSHDEFLDCLDYFSILARTQKEMVFAPSDLSSDAH